MYTDNFLHVDSFGRASVIPQKARVVAVDSAEVTVEVETMVACARCAAGKGCGAGLLVGPARKKQITVPHTNGLRLRRGDLVLLTMHPRRLLRAAVLAYGLPLFAAILALLLGNWLRNGLDDAAAVSLAAVGLAAGLLVGRRGLRQAGSGCAASWMPVISERLAAVDRAGAADVR